jgi:hypothetical protein
MPIRIAPTSQIRTSATWYFEPQKRHYRVYSTHASYSGGPGLNCRPRDQNPDSFVVFFSPYTQLP